MQWVPPSTAAAHRSHHAFPHDVSSQHRTNSAWFACLDEQAAAVAVAAGGALASCPSPSFCFSSPLPTPHVNIKTGGTPPSLTLNTPHPLPSALQPESLLAIALRSPFVLFSSDLDLELSVCVSIPSSLLKTRCNLRPSRQLPQTVAPYLTTSKQKHLCITTHLSQNVRPKDHHHPVRL